MCAVELVLQFPAPLRLVHCIAHRGRYGVGVENDHSLGVAGGAADRLDKARLTAQEALLVRVQYRHQRHLRQIKPLAQQVDAHQHIELAQPQIADDLHALQRGHIGVHIAHPDAQGAEVGGQILRHLFRERCDQHALVFLLPRVYLRHKVVYLPDNGAHLHPWVEKPRGADDLLHDLIGLLPLKLAGGGGDEHRLRKASLELLEFQWSVVEGAGQAEAVVHQTLLAGVVAVVHGAYLRQRDMALVHEQHKILGKEVQQRHGRTAHGPLRDNAGVIFNAGAVAQRAHHLHIVAGALVEPLRLHQLTVVLKPFPALGQLTLDLLRGALQLVLRGDIVAGGIHRRMGKLLYRRPRDGVELRNAVYLVAEELHAQGAILVIGGIQLHGVAADAEYIALKGDVVALVAILHQTAQQLVALHGHARAQGDHHAGEVLRLAQTVDAAHGRNNNNIPPLQQGAGGTQAQPVYLLVGRGILFNVGVGVGNICLRLVVVVVADEILHGVVGKELAEFLTQLGGQRLVVRQHQRRAVHPFDDLRHREGLAAAGNALEHLRPQAVFQSPRQLVDGLRLVARRLVGGDNFEIRHGFLPSLLQKAALGHGYIVVVRHDNVVGQTDAQGHKCLLYLLRYQHILPGGQSHAAGVVVRQNNGTRSRIKSVFHHLPHLHG